MALKKKIKADDFEKLTDVVKALYAKDGDDYALDIEGDEDTGALKRAKDREAQAAKELREENAKLRKEKEDAERAAKDAVELEAIKRGDLSTLTKSWEGKLAAQKAEHDKALAAKDGHLRELLVDSVANSLAAKISTVPRAMARLIKDRLSVDMTGDSPTTVVLDEKGQVSALNLVDLEKEFVANKDFAPMLIGSKASGGGATTKPLSRPAGGAGAVTIPSGAAAKTDMTAMSPKDLVSQLAQLKADREASA